MSTEPITCWMEGSDLVLSDGERFDASDADEDVNLSRKRITALPDT